MTDRFTMPVASVLVDREYFLETKYCIRGESQLTIIQYRSALNFMIYQRYDKKDIYIYCVFVHEIVN